MSMDLRDKPKGTGTLAPALLRHTESTQSDWACRAPNDVEANVNHENRASSQETVGPRGPQIGRYYSPESEENEKAFDNNTPQKLSDERGDVLGNPNGLSWQQVSALLGAEYISLAILSFPWVRLQAEVLFIC